jgi:hypothetical protein
MSYEVFHSKEINAILFFDSFAAKEHIKLSKDCKSEYAIFESPRSTCCYKIDNAAKNEIERLLLVWVCQSNPGLNKTKIYLVKKENEERFYHEEKASFLEKINLIAPSTVSYVLINTDKFF